MKHLKDMLTEAKVWEDKIDDLEKKVEKAEEKAEQAQKDAEKAEDKADDAEKEANKAEESIKDEKSFRDYAENKFKEVFGDDLDEKKMKDVVDGILNDCKDEVEKGEFGTAIGMLNKSFGK